MKSLMVSISGVRGIVGPEFNPMVVGQWVAALAEVLPPGPVVIGRDSRPSGEVLSAAAASTLRSLGREVWDVGLVPTPTVQLAVERLGAAGGVILSASHNPSAWNALKFVDQDGSFLSPERFRLLAAAHAAGTCTFRGSLEYSAARDRHEESLALHESIALSLVQSDRVRAARLRVVLETGHGAGGVLLSRIAAALGVELDGRRLEPTGDLPSNPEPTIETLEPLLRTAGSGTHFVAMVDPDADRFGIGLPGTAYVGEEWTLPLAARWRMESQRGPLCTNLSTSTRLEAVAERFGVNVFRTPVGEAHVVAEMKRVGAVIGGEGNGGVIDPKAHLGRDSAVAFVLLCAAEAEVPGGLRALAEELPPRHMVKRKVKLGGTGLGAVEEAVAPLLGTADDRRDGLRWSLPGGFVHLRASNTEPIVRLLVETASREESEERARALAAAIEPLA